MFDSNIWRHELLSPRRVSLLQKLLELREQSELRIYFTYENLQELSSGRSRHPDVSFNSIFDNAYRITREM